MAKTFRTKGDAAAWASEIETEIRAGAGKIRYKKTLAEAMVKYKLEVSPKKKGARWDEIRINKLMRELDFVGKLIGDVDVTDISKWRDASLRRLAPSTVNRELNVLSAVFTMAVKEWRWCSSNPVRDTKRPKNHNNVSCIQTSTAAHPYWTQVRRMPTGQPTMSCLLARLKCTWQINLQTKTG